VLEIFDLTGRVAAVTGGDRGIGLDFLMRNRLRS